MAVRAWARIKIDPSLHWAGRDPWCIRLKSSRVTSASGMRVHAVVVKDPPARRLDDFVFLDPAAGKLPVDLKHEPIAHRLGLLPRQAAELLCVTALIDARPRANAVRGP